MQPQIRSYHEHAPLAVRHLVETAEILSVSEADVFRLAYRYWYERELGEALLDDSFGSYLTHGELPEWVRGFCRTVLQKAAYGHVDPREFGVETPRRLHCRDAQFAWLTSLAAFIIFWRFLA